MEGREVEAAEGVEVDVRNSWRLTGTQQVCGRIACDERVVFSVWIGIRFKNSLTHLRIVADCKHQCLLVEEVCGKHARYYQDVTV